MHARPVLAALAITSVFIATGCGSHQTIAKIAAASGTSAPASTSNSTPSGSAPTRHLGDFFVHRFSGSFAQTPLTLTEEVVAVNDDAWVVDFSLTQNEVVERLRVRFDARSGAPISAADVDGATETKAPLSDYEAMMARTIYSADVNDGLVSSNARTCLVGTDELDCETKTYRVWIGDRPAQLAIVHASTFPDRDVSGEITTEDGKLVYRAELVEARQGKPARGVASR